MKVFPMDMERLDARDIRGSLRTISEYIRYMKEQIEFRFSANDKRRISIDSDSGNLLDTLETIANRLVSLESELATVQNTSLSSQESIANLQGIVSALAERVNGIENFLDGNMEL